MDVNAIAQFIANKAAGVSGVRGASPGPVDTIPATPYAVVLPVQDGSIIPGSWERRRMHFPVWLLIGRVADAARNQSSINGYVENMLATYRTSGTESGTVASTVVTTYRTDQYVTVGAEDYQFLEFIVEVVVNSSAGYTP